VRKAKTREALEKYKQSEVHRRALVSNSPTNVNWVSGLAGILTSAFFTKVAPASLAGSIGLFVLVCTAVNQRFRPGVRQSGAVQRAQKLRVILRAANDEFARLRSSQTPEAAVESTREIRWFSVEGDNRLSIYSSSPQMPIVSDYN
jgi:hypothetical protein